MKYKKIGKLNLDVQVKRFNLNVLSHEGWVTQLFPGSCPVIW